MSFSGKTLMFGAALRLTAIFADLAAGLYLTPLIRAAMGATQFGLWQVVGSLLGFYGMLDLGIAGAISRFVSRALAHDDQAAVQRYFSDGIKLLAILGVLIVALTLAAAGAASWMMDVPADAHALTWSVVIMGLTLALVLNRRVFEGVLMAHLRFDLIAGIRIAGAVMKVCFISVALRGSGVFGTEVDANWLGGSLDLNPMIALAACMAAIQIIENLIFAAVTLKVHPGLKLGVSSADTRREVLAYGSKTLFAQLSDLMRLQMSPIVIAGARSAALAGDFAIGNKLNQMVGQLVAATMSLLQPVFSRQEAIGDLAVMRATYFFTCRISTYASSLLAGCMFLFCGPFLQLWMGEILSPSTIESLVSVVRILLIGTLFASAQLPSVGLLYGTSRNGIYARLNFIHGVLVLGGMALLAGPYGLIGVALASTVPTVIIKFIFLPIESCRVIEVPASEFIVRHFARDLLTPLPFLVAAGYLALPWAEPNISRILVLSGLICMTFIPYILLVGFDVSQRNRLLSAAFGSLPRLGARKG